jgi:serine/threonine protein kinase
MSSTYEQRDRWELIRERGRPVLILERPGCELVGRLIGTPMSMERFLELAVSQAAALGRLRERGRIHKDIKPVNILANSAMDVWLMSFGIACSSTAWATTQGVLRCGSFARTPGEMHGQLWEAMRAGRLFSFKCLHDRVQKGDYSVIAKEPRPQAHLRIGSGRQSCISEHKSNGIAHSHGSET